MPDTERESTERLWQRLESLEPSTARRLRGAKLNDGELRRAVHAAECRASAGVELDDL